ncbi:TOMM precursor leader peptide-binding protein [Streptomyces sp. NPDC055607]
MSDPSSAPLVSVGITGDGGELHAAVASALPEAVDLRGSTAPPSGCGVVVVVTENADVSLRVTAEASSRDRGVPCLPVHLRGTHVQIGPLSSPAREGCGRCADLRRAEAADPALPGPPTGTEDGRRNGFALRIAAAHTALETARAVPGSRPAGLGTCGAFLTVDMIDLTVRRHAFLPDADCPQCGPGLPPDTAEAARVVLRPRPKPKGGFRARTLSSMEEDLLNTYVDRRAGVVRELRPGGLDTLPTALAPVGPANGFGRALDMATARLSAITEAVERMSGLRQGGKRTTVRASRAELGARAIDPVTLGLHASERYADPAFPYRRYSDDEVCDWIWGHSFGRDEPVLVPRTYVYYGAHEQRADRPDVPFAFTSSNGTAVGSCAEEAILHGLLELAERDAFLMTWYGRLPVPRIDPYSLPDRTVPLLIERIRERTGFHVDVFATTMEQRIPSFWVMGRADGDDPRRMKTLSSAGSGLDASDALLGALCELTPLLDLQPAGYRERYERAGRLVEDSSLVADMDDHSLLYGHPDAFGRFDFLFAGSPARDFAEVTREWEWPEHDDLRADCLHLVARYLDSGLDVVAVDLTTPELRAGGLTSFKVVVPGLLPMTFGHHNRRTTGLSRLLTVPPLLGFTNGPASEEELNADPHPFP